MLNIESTGQGPDLALLHGWGMHGGAWGDLAERLAPRFRVHRVDLPGYGASPAMAGWTPAAVADRVLARLPQPLFVAGWSLGGQIAAWMAAKSAAVRRVALVASNPCFTRRPGWEAGLDAAAVDAVAAAVAVDPASALSQFCALQAHGDDRRREVLRRLRALVDEAPAPDADTLLAGLAALRDDDWRPLAASLAQPLLVVCGGNDALVPPAAAEWLAARAANAVLARLPGAAHAPQLSDPDRLATHLLEFFS